MLTCPACHGPVEADRELGPPESLVALIPAGVLFVGSAILVFRLRRPALVLQLLGAIGLIVVVATHVCEALRLFPSMHWGAEHSLGHYVDLGSTVGALTLFPIGYVLHAFAQARASVAHDEVGWGAACARPH